MKQIVLLLAVYLSVAACSDEGDLRNSKCPSLLPGWKALGSDIVHSIQWNKVEIGQSGITWNGVPVDKSELEKYLNITRDLNPTPLVIFDPAGASSCQIASKIRDTVDNAADCNSKSACFQGNSRIFDEVNKVYSDDPANQPFVVPNRLHSGPNPPKRPTSLRPA
jgi:hypothetical protein